MSQVRLRRLTSDHERLTDLARRHPRLTIVQAVGTPPDRYQINFKVRSARKSGETITYVMDHLVEITLPAAFPRTPPLCRMLTPVFHPNIAPHAICIGDHWSPGESLSSLVIRIAEMLAFQSYNTKSPLNGEAARWVEQNIASLPVDPGCMTLDDPSPPPAGSTQVHIAAPITAPPAHQSAASSAAAEPKLTQVTCQSCGTQLKVAVASQAVRARCPRCRTLTLVPAQGPAHQ
jgi:ubiquitin-protein ligase